jgi:2-haloacid dehalogenase
MLGNIHGVPLKPSDIDEIKKAMMTIPAHADVVEGLQRLKSAGFRMVTLTNSPANPDGQGALEHAGLGRFFERRFSIEMVRAYKPALSPITWSDVPLSSCWRPTFGTQLGLEAPVSPLP